jgi:alkylation response protein AidB-like acyl-CoA dehydrogenase
MVVYKAPLNDMRFLLKTMGRDLDKAADLDIVLTQAARFVEEQLAPINAVGDRKGCQFADGKVSLPREMVTAYARYAEAGWMGVNLPETWGGQNLSATMGAFTGEMLSSANPAFSMIPALTMSACKAIMAFGSSEIQQQYLPSLASGEWTGTMCMTEAHCGSDLGLIRTSAIAQGDTHYAISGTKIFISAGEQNLTSNIVHLVLARIKGAVDGVKGLSLFLVPKLLPDSGLPNTVACIGLEEKMGIHGNPTCTMSFEASYRLSDRSAE